MRNQLIFISFWSLLLLFGACGTDTEPEDEMPMVGDLENIEFDPQNYTIEVPESFPTIVTLNPGDITVDGVALGRHLFYDPILSEDLSQSCSSCHLPAGSFTDNLAVSTGIDGVAGKRSSMSLLNLVYNDESFFWDGRSPSLEEQALLPVEDIVELHNTWPVVIDRLKNHDDYPTMFRKAFGILDRSEITKELAADAIAQFEKTLVSSGKSKYDREIAGTFFYSPDELAGHDMYFDRESDDLPDAECAHCHGGALFTTNEFFNNGLDAVESVLDFDDIGLGMVTQDTFDYGKFRAPTLRNIVNTAPYMHDGRFETLEEVVDHYFSGGHLSSTIDPLMNDLRAKSDDFTEEHKRQLIAFLKTLNDPVFMENPDFQSPF